METIGLAILAVGVAYLGNTSKDTVEAAFSLTAAIACIIRAFI